MPAARWTVRRRITAIALLLFAIVLGLAGTTVTQTVRWAREGAVDDRLRARADVVAQSWSSGDTDPIAGSI